MINLVARQNAGIMPYLVLKSGIRTLYVKIFKGKSFVVFTVL